MTVGERSGRSPRTLLRHRVVFGIALVLLGAGCGDDEEPEVSVDTATSVQPEDESSTTTETALPACGVVDHVAVFNTFGVVTTAESDGSEWVANPEAELEPREGATGVVAAYQDRGYEILYVSSLPAGTDLAGQPITDALTVWLGSHGFPIGDNTRVWAREDAETEASVALIEELARLSNNGTQGGAGYAANEDEVFPLATGGIPRELIFTVGEAASDETSTSIPGEDLLAHLPELEELDPVCE